MKPIRSLLLLAMAAFLSACVGNTSGSTSTPSPSPSSDPAPSSEETYTITWKNYDGTVLEIDEGVGRYEWPTYDGATPTKPKDEEHNYEFSGWTPEVGYPSSDTEYTATFEEAKRTYTITWKDNEGNILGTSETARGNRPFFGGELPAAPSDCPEHCGYVWSWSPELVEATADAEYSGQYYLKLDDKAFYEDATLTSYEIPAGVRLIGDHAFYYCTSLTSITIPEGVEAIGKSAFAGCSALTSVTLPSSLAEMDWNTFGRCSSLASVNIPSSLVSIPDGAFQHCPSLTEVKFADDGVLTSIGGGAFLGSAITSLVIPETVTEIGEQAFRNCDSLTSITLPKGITKIEDGLLRGCSSLPSVAIPEGVTEIGELAFAECYALTSLVIPEGVTSIGDECFDNCKALVSLSLPSTLVTVGENIFRFEEDLQKDIHYGGTREQWESASYKDQFAKSLIHFPDGTAKPMDGYVHEDEMELTYTYVAASESWTMEGNYLYHNTKSDIDIPESIHDYPVTTLGRYALYLDTNSQDCRVSIPNSVTTIKSEAIGYCLFTEPLIIPESVVTIEDTAFKICSGDVYCEATERPSGWSGSWWSSPYTGSEFYVYWYSETEPTTKGNYWRYVNSEPKAW